MIVLPILISTLVVILFWYLLNLILWVRRAAKLTENMIGPKPLPIIGNAQHFANITNLNEGGEKLLELFKLYSKPPDKIFKFWLGPKLLIGIANPEYIEEIVTSEHTLGKDELVYGCFNAFSDGVLSANGKKWAELRKIVNPFTNRKAIEPNLNMFHEKAMKLARIIDSKVDDDQVFNLKSVIAKCALDMMLVSNYGCDINEMENDDRPESLEGIFEDALDRLFKLAMKLPTCLSIKYSTKTPLGNVVIKKAKVFWNLVAEVLQSRKKQTAHNDGKRKLYADLLIQKAERDNLSWEEAGRLTTDYLIAGSHSASLMSSTVILMLAMNPEYQEAVYQEQVEILGEDTEVAPTWEQLSKMIYLTRVYKEVLRLFTVPLIVRAVTEDLDLGKHILPKGSILLISVNSLHRDPEIWSHPEEFYPDHFLPEECARRPKNSYVPFSLGPRKCPGALYADIAVKTLVSTLVRKFHFKTDLKYKELTYKFSLFMDVTEGQMVKKVPRISK